MLLIACPWCGERDETEFHYGGQAHVAYPADPESLTDAEWGAYLFVRDNPKGEFAERWVHTAGCRRWFNVVRHTVTHDISAVYPAGRPRPDAQDSGGQHSGGQDSGGQEFDRQRAAQQSEVTA